ncbi:hypothetical protein BJP39_17920 [Streptomyces sp. CC77]|nr:hypothetical protein BJP39_17920 [Streptomyces sp. CC77]
MVSTWCMGNSLYASVIRSAASSLRASHRLAGLNLSASRRCRSCSAHSRWYVMGCGRSAGSVMPSRAPKDRWLAMHLGK